jgi:hypothetical protein
LRAAWGDYRATSLSPAGKWQVGPQAGSFTDSYPLELPPSIGDDVPELGFGYDSSNVDGRTSATNSQASWAGLGWDLGLGSSSGSTSPDVGAGLLLLRGPGAVLGISRTSDSVALTSRTRLTRAGLGGVSAYGTGVSDSRRGDPTHGPAQRGMTND